MPVLLLFGEGLYKTVKFRKPSYVGDPINAVKIFNEKEVDELVVLDITATKEGRGPNYQKIYELAGEAFMPMAYGGGIRTFDQAKKVFDAGFEKVVVNTALFENPALLEQIGSVYGGQSVVASIDASKSWMGGYNTYIRSGSKKTGLSPAALAAQAELYGAGEIMINSIDRDGTWEGYDLDLIRSVSESVSLPVIACGGAANPDDFMKAVSEGKASAVAAGSMFVYHKKGMGVLINFPLK